MCRLIDLSYQYIVFYYSKQFIVDVTSYFLWAVQFSFSFGMHGFAHCFKLSDLEA